MIIICCYCSCCCSHKRNRYSLLSTILDFLVGKPFKTTFIISTFATKLAKWWHKHLLLHHSLHFTTLSPSCFHDLFVCLSMWVVSVIIRFVFRWIFFSFHINAVFSIKASHETIFNKLNFPLFIYQKEPFCQKYEHNKNNNNNNNDNKPNVEVFPNWNRTYLWNLCDGKIWQWFNVSAFSLQIPYTHTYK